jgi:hypothetical protein
VSAHSKENLLRLITHLLITQHCVLPFPFALSPFPFAFPRDLKMFLEWFDVEFSSDVFDLLDDPVETLDYGSKEADVISVTQYPILMYLPGFTFLLSRSSFGGPSINVKSLVAIMNCFTIIWLVIFILHPHLSYPAFLERDRLNTHTEHPSLATHRSFLTIFHLTIVLHLE